MNQSLVTFGQKAAKEWRGSQSLLFVRRGGTLCVTSRAVKQKTPRPGASGSCKTVQKDS